MNVHTFLSGIVLSVLVSAAHAAAISEPIPAPASSQEGIVFDVQTGNYVITYEAEDEIRPEGLYQTIFIPATKIGPAIKSRFHHSFNDKIIVYKYKIKNEPSAEQKIGGIDLVVTNMQPDIESPANWKGMLVTNFDGPGLHVGWSYWGEDDLGGIAPRTTLNGFGIKSNDLPGIGLMRFRGATPVLAFAGDGLSEEMEKQINSLRKIEVDSISRPAAVPLIPVTNPFDAAAVLTSMQKHVNQDLVTMKLIDPAFAAQLDRLLQATVTAAKGGNIVALRGDIKDLRRMLKSEHADVDKEDEGGDIDDDKEKDKGKSKLIDKLAAKVLDFDLRYVEQRLKGKESQDKDG